jgi:hypothetical protein
MKFIQICSILLFFGGNILTDRKPKPFEVYSDSILKEFNISFRIPRKFNDLKYEEWWRVRHDRFVGYVFSPILQSENQDCIIMYPIAFTYQTESSKRISKINRIIGNSMSNNSVKVDDSEITTEKIVRINIMYQLRTALGHVTDDMKIINDSVFSFNDHVQVISGRKAHKSFNADSVFVYDIPMEEAYKEKYVHTAAMFITKKDRPAIELLWFFTEHGKKRNNVYFKRFYKTIWYN